MITIDPMVGDLPQVDVLVRNGEILAVGKDLSAEGAYEISARGIRGFHDSLVNHLGNRAPKILLCLNEGHVVSIAHGYAEATDKPMACELHSNVGLMHGSMAIFNAWCDRMPIVVVGATGPGDAFKRRPWIDWIHTMKDQGALIRAFTKWDDEPRSADALAEAMLRGFQLATTDPFGPVYICLDAALQEQKVEHEINLPNPARYRPPGSPSAPDAAVKELAHLLLNTKGPLLLFGRGSRKQDDWERHILLAKWSEHRCQPPCVSSVFPTEHALHAAHPFYWANQRVKDIVKNSDVIEEAIVRGLNVLRSSHPYSIDAVVKQGYFTPPYPAAPNNSRTEPQ